MIQKLDIANWNRKEHFEFFRKFDEPFFGITTNIDCTKAYAASKTLGVSFFTYYMHKTLAAVHAIESFRYRISGDDILIFDRIDVSSTILREDTTFGFSLIEYSEDIHVFAEAARIEIERVRNTPGLITTDFTAINHIHFSTLPWVHFTSISHARNFSFPDSCPKISFGKMITNANGNKQIPISIHVHHALMDGYHVGQFIECFGKAMDGC